MSSSIAPKIYGTNLQAFVEKAFRFAHGNKLGSTERYVSFIVFHLELFLGGEIKRLLVNLPGRHLKTFMCSVCLPAFMLGIDASLKFLIVAHNEELAEDIVRQIREIMHSAWYKKVFNTRPDPNHSKKDDFKVIGGGRVRAAPVQSVTGKGGDIIIFDDPHNVNDWDNERKKLKVIEAFEALVSRRDGGAMSRMLVVGHRVAEDDLSADIIDRSDFKHICLPLYGHKELIFKFGDESFHLAKGEALRPEAFPAGEIKSIRQHHQGSPFWLYYMQGFGTKKDEFLIDVCHFPFIDWARESSLARRSHVVLSVDPAQKTASASRNVIHVYAVDGNRYVLVRAFAEKCTFARLVFKVRRYAQNYGAKLIIVENTARGPDLIDELQCDIQVPIRPVNPRGNKAARLRECMPIIRAKRVHVRKNQAEVEAAVDEILAYPNCAYDDHVDALTNFLGEAATFTAETFGNTQPWPTQRMIVAHYSQRCIGSSSVGYVGVPRGARASRTALPDFSNGTAQPSHRADGRSPYSAEGGLAPVYSYNGQKMVRIK